jgi:hypothetical protein
MLGRSQTQRARVPLHMGKVKFPALSLQKDAETRTGHPRLWLRRGGSRVSDRSVRPTGVILALRAGRVDSKCDHWGWKPRIVADGLRGPRRAALPRWRPAVGRCSRW